MRILILLILIQLNTSSILAQEWAKQSSQWYYSQYQFNPFAKDVYHKIESEGDTVLNNKYCRELVWKRISLFDSTQNSIFTYESNDSIFFYDTFYDTFYLVYRFDAEPGDTIEGGYNRDKLRYWIDSTKKQVLLNGDTTTIQYITNDRSTKYLYYIAEPVIVGIGALGWLLPNSRTADPPTGGRLNCYIEEGDWLYSTSQYCGIITGSTEITTQLIVSPNPTSDYIRIETDKRVNKVEIATMNGRTVSQKGSKIVELPEPPGMYILRVLMGGKTYEAKVIKQGY